MTSCFFLRADPGGRRAAPSDPQSGAISSTKLLFMAAKTESRDGRTAALPSKQTGAVHC